MTVAVVGLGKIGLPLAVAIAGSGRSVIGLDVAPAVAESVGSGRVPFEGEPDLERRLGEVHQLGRLSATTDPAAAIPGAEVVIVVVPLVVDDANAPDFRAIDGATASIAPLLGSGTLVSYETTLPVGVTRGRFAPALESASGLPLGRELFVCHSPERVSSGSVFADLRRYPKLVGGVDPRSAEVAVDFYRSVLDFDDREDLGRPNGVWDLGSSEAAELAKLAETTYRDLNIAFANELAIAAEALAVDVWSIIEACNSQPYSHLHRPGVAVAGHCIPVYPHLLDASVPGLRLPSVARSINAAMPGHVVDRLDRALGGLHGLTIAILGLAYRGGVKEDFRSGAYPLCREVEARGGVALVHDPLYGDAEISARGLKPFRLGDPCDAAIVHTDHLDYADLRSTDLPGARLVLDGRRTVDPDRLSGLDVRQLGVGP